ncbi:DNA replication/repair protein RecF [Scatolibacter rhodanostii]|uniref:DNA replication/repair protein RecF n=1 Tax=Scatolibacter rhodanostii TaxID=2014781 RepID=UPI000C080F23|nr:DNA replication/repair protein RecF [Scatolibacter rhodanostii]
MYIKRIVYENFRNLADGEILPDEGMNVIYGENAQGKTNLLETIWLFTGGHSFRGTKDCELPKLEKETGNNSHYTKLKADFFKEERNQTAVLNIERGRRRSVINGVEKKTGSALVGKICAVIFSPEHLQLVKEGPSTRRNFIDSAICQINPSYVRTLTLYNRLLLQRNALLKDIVRHPDLSDTLEVWNLRLAKYGVQIMIQRADYMRLLQPKCDFIYDGIAKGREDMKIAYAPNVFFKQDEFTEESLEIVMIEELKKSERTDIKTGHTTVGPHRDDLSIEIGGVSARLFASQGQQRSAVLAMKLAEAEILQEKTYEAPIILLDDVMSELDSNRQDYLLNHLYDKQVFITCCSPESVNLMQKGKRFYLENGVVSAE